MITSNLRHLPALVLNIPKTLSNLQQPGRQGSERRSSTDLAMACRPKHQPSPATPQKRRLQCSAVPLPVPDTTKTKPEAWHLPCTPFSLQLCNLDSVWAQHKAMLQLVLDITGRYDPCSALLVLGDPKAMVS